MTTLKHPRQRQATHRRPAASGTGREPLPLAFPTPYFVLAPSLTFADPTVLSQPRGLLTTAGIPNHARKSVAFPQRTLATSKVASQQNRLWRSHRVGKTAAARSGPVDPQRPGALATTAGFPGCGQSRPKAGREKAPPPAPGTQICLAAARPHQFIKQTFPQRSFPIERRAKCANQHLNRPTPYKHGSIR